MKGIKIVSTGRALPGKIVTNENLAEYMDTSDEWIYSRTGIHSRYQCEKESCVSLAVGAARTALLKAGLGVEEIGAVIVATTTPDYIFPSVACMVQKELGLSEEVMAFDLTAACSGFLLALGAGRGILDSLKKKYALIIGSEQLSRILDYEDRSSCILFGDGAGAVLITESDNAFGQKAWSRGNLEALSCLGPGNAGAKLKMKGNDVFKFAVKALDQGITEILKEEALSMEDIDYVICHQANARIIGHIQKKYPKQQEKFYLNIEKYGNTSAASIPIVLDQLMEEGKLKEGMKIICVAFGAGLTWTSVYMQL